MKFKLFGEPKESKSTAYPEGLTAENAQKIADAALEVKCARWADMTIDYALRSIKVLSEDGRYYAYYKLYATSEIAKEIKSGTLTDKMCNKIEEITSNKLTALGYKVKLSYYGPNRTIEISWEEKEEKK